MKIPSNMILGCKYTTKLMGLNKPKQYIYYKHLLILQVYIHIFIEH